jgi:hypothetical protein
MTSSRSRPARSLFAVVIVASIGCSAGADAKPRADAKAKPEPGAEMDSMFAGFRLLAPQERVLADARARGLQFECRTDEAFDAICSPGLEPPAGRPALSFAFRGGRLVGLVRSATKEQGAPPTGVMAAQFTRAFGTPVVEGWINPYLHARMWTNADTSLIGVLTCDNPTDERTCEPGLDHTVGTRLPQILHDWRGMIEQNAARAPAPAAPPRP